MEWYTDKLKNTNSYQERETKKHPITMILHSALAFSDSLYRLGVLSLVFSLILVSLGKRSLY